MFGPTCISGIESETPAQVGVRLLVRGQVQGVGFRPFVYRLAHECQLTGEVRNTAVGVAILLEGDAERVACFRERLVAETPQAAIIDEVQVEATEVTGCTTFVIEPSDAAAVPIVRVPRDLAICGECRDDIMNASNRRKAYPFTNCTNCGPRYSIIEAMPYDRPVTTMHGFAMCATCRVEYDTPEDRRFHAQPIACSKCGPQIGLWDRDGSTVAGPDSAIRATAELLRQGQIVAMKGVGGFQLLVRADSDEAMFRLRQRKNRPTKPFAIMVPSLDEAEQLAILTPTERQLLCSPQNPIVLCKARHNAGLVGLLLPTTPLHCLLLDELRLPVVATSGNRSDEPIVTEEAEAVGRLAGIADSFLVHDRPITRRVDDSVMRVIAGKPTTIRLARGYAPLPLPDFAGPPTLALGAHQKSALALWSGAQAMLAQHVGDLDHPDTRVAFEGTVQDLMRLYRFAPEVIACDLHPDYFTTQWAIAQGKRLVQVQHHHAHAVACMVENQLLDREVLAFVWDGTGYSPDGTIWGGECLLASVTSFRRVASLFPFPLPGGESVIRHPNRLAFALLGCDARWATHLSISSSDAKLLLSMITRGVNSPKTSSVGRLFDAVAALLGFHEVSYEGEAAVWLEAIADDRITVAYTLSGGDWRPMLMEMLDDILRDVDLSTISARFHNALARWAAEVASQHPGCDIVLSGGCFQNRLLTERTVEALTAINRRVYTHGQIPPNDGGIAVGQLAVALAEKV